MKKSTIILLCALLALLIAAPATLAGEVQDKGKGKGSVPAQAEKAAQPDKPEQAATPAKPCLLYTSPSPRDRS